MTLFSHIILEALQENPYRTPPQLAGICGLPVDVVGQSILQLHAMSQVKRQGIDCTDFSYHDTYIYIAVKEYIDTLHQMTTRAKDREHAQRLLSRRAKEMGLAIPQLYHIMEVK